MYNLQQCNNNNNNIFYASFPSGVGVTYALRYHCDGKIIKRRKTQKPRRAHHCSGATAATKCIICNMHGIQ